MAGISEGTRSLALAGVVTEISALEVTFLDPVTDKFHPWRNLWQGLVGAAYSLGQALGSLKGTPRAFSATVVDARDVLSRLSSAAMPGHEWVSGYWLNSAEYRIASVLHQTLKAAFACREGNCSSQRKYVQWLAQHILNGSCGICGSSIGALESGGSRAVKALAEEDAASPLLIVHEWVNGLKHDLIPDPDVLPTERRWDTDREALAALTDLLRGVAVLRGQVRINH